MSEYNNEMNIVINWFKQYEEVGVWFLDGGSSRTAVVESKV